MAKLTPKDELSVVADWKTGRYSQRDLASKYNCSKGKVSQLTEGVEKAKNDHLVNAQISLISARAYLSDEELTAIMTTAQNEVFNKGLVTNSSQLALVRATELLVSNKVDDKLNVGDGVQNYEPRQLNTSDLKNLIDTIDKASITLNVNDRFAPKQDINLNNNNQVITVEIE